MWMYLCMFYACPCVYQRCGGFSSYWNYINVCTHYITLHRFYAMLFWRCSRMPCFLTAVVSSSRCSLGLATVVRFWSVVGHWLSIFIRMKPGGLKNLSITGGQCLIDVPRFSAVQYMLLAALRFETDSFCFSLKSLTFYISRVFFHRGV